MTSALPTSALPSATCPTVLPGEDHATSPADGSEPGNIYTIPAEKVVTSKGATTQTDAPAPSTAPNTHEEGQWSFNTTRDERAYGLTAEQCDAAFPGLFTEIDRAIEYRNKIGKITPDDVDISWKEHGAVRAAIIDQQLYVLETKFSGSGVGSLRGLSLLHAIHRAIITSPSPIPNVEFSFSTTDIADPKNRRHSIWALTRTEEQEEKWLMSDFGYWSWPNDVVGAYEQIRREIAINEMDFADKKKQVVWRGALNTNSIRKNLLSVTANKDWADVEAMQWIDTNSTAGNGVTSNSIPIPGHCQYQFVIQTEGNSYSGRGKYLQNCNSVVIMHKRTWLEPHHPLLIPSGPSQNIVEVETDFSDLEEKISFLLQNPKQAQRIAKNGIDAFRDRYLTPAAQACYWRRMLGSWADVSFVPEEWEIDEMTGTRTIRGMPFESFV
ncbi:Protein O-glucosyltransferase 1 [Lachnellula arida]|uniref:Protein O-glucosyltransferase 1 n=1 Tax=Lachnellula arida TaxID=1316785 RepID=A0A8T9BGD8_9HELO|nr:Protein O-glucosyltransferase 1 [Lachnellula arida]